MVFFLLLVLWLAALLAGAWVGASMQLAVGVPVVFVAAIPLWVALAYSSAINLQHSLNQVIVPRWWHHLFAGHLVRLPVLLLVSLWFGIEVLADLLINSRDSVLWLAIAAGLCGLLSELFLRHLTNYKPYYWTRAALRLGVPIAGGLAALGWALFHSVNPSGESAHYTGTSQLLRELVDSGGLWNAVQGEMAGYLPGWAVFLLQLVSASVYYSQAALAAGGLRLMGSGEWRRIYVVGTERPSAVPRSGLFLTSLLFTLIAVIFLFLAAAAEEYLLATARDPGRDSATADPGFPTRPSELRKAIEREGVGGLICRVGTIKALRQADLEFRDAVQTNAALISERTDIVFDAMRARVPEFLDWYYSLTADYLRTGHVLLGDGTDYLDRRLAEVLAPTGTFDAIEALSREVTQMHLNFASKRLAILSACSRGQDQSEVKIVAQYDSAEALSTLGQLNALLAGGTHFGWRAGGSAFAGAAVGAVVVKVGVSSSFKLAAKVLVKLASKKATTFVGGLAAGAAIGGAGGTVVPGAGNAVGAVVGGVAGGIAVMVGVDFLALKLEEEVSRSKFEADLMAAITNVEREVKAALRTPQLP